MFVSRFTTLPSRSSHYGAVPSAAQTAPRAPRTLGRAAAAASNAAVGHGRRRRGPDQAARGPARHAREGRSKEQDDRGRRANRFGLARRPQRPLGGQRVRLPAARLCSPTRDSSARTGPSCRGRAPSCCGACARPRGHGVQVLRLAADARLRRRTAVLYDAYVEAKPNAALNLRVGKFSRRSAWSAAVGDRRAVHRARPADGLVPNRDVGMQLYGDLAKARVQYQVGAFDGAARRRQRRRRCVDEETSWAAVLPAVRDECVGPGSGIRHRGQLGDGGGDARRAGTRQLSHDGPARAVPLSRRRHGGEHRASGRAAHAVSPQGYLYVGPGGRARRVRADAQVRARLAWPPLTNRAWQVSGAWVLTGERESYTSITPDHPLDAREAAGWAPKAGTAGGRGGGGPGGGGGGATHPPPHHPRAPGPPQHEHKTENPPLPLPRGPRGDPPKKDCSTSRTTRRASCTRTSTPPSSSSRTAARASRRARSSTGLEADVVTLALAYDIDAIATRRADPRPTGRSGCRTTARPTPRRSCSSCARATPRASRTGTTS